MKCLSLLPLLGLAAAFPVNDKRDVVIQDVVTTQYVTTTIWIDPADPTPAAFFEGSSRSSASVPTSSAAPSSSAAPPPAQPTTTTPAAAAPTPAAAPAAPAPAAGGPSGTGQLTFYDVGMGIGSCGFAQASPNDYVVAVNSDDMNAGYSGNSNNNPLCGKAITITYGGKSVTGKVYDSCPTCNKGDLDLSMGYFLNFGTESQGRLSGATWTIAA